MLLIIISVFAWIYVESNPLLFNESFWTHAHCIKIASVELRNYADKHNGEFPFHPDGYGDALLLLDQEFFFALTGPGFDPAFYDEVKRKGQHLAENKCGRVYVQGLNTHSLPNTVILFDRLPTPGGDHCHFPFRLWAPLGREVCYIDGNTEFVVETAWPQFALKQIELLVESGIQKERAKELYGLK